MTDRQTPEVARQADPFIELVAEVFRIHRRIRSLFSEPAESTGLTRIQNSLLATVIETNNRHTVAQLGRSLGYPRQVIQRTTNELIDRGLLEMVDNPADRRARFVFPTEAGLELKSIADEWARRVSGELQSDMEIGLCGKITADLQQLRKAIDEHTKRKAATRSAFETSTGSAR